MAKTLTPRARATYNRKESCATLSTPDRQTTVQIKLNEVSEPRLLDVIRDLLEWDAHLGYHEAPAWDRAKAASQTNFVSVPVKNA